MRGRQHPLEIYRKSGKNFTTSHSAPPRAARSKAPPRGRKGGSRPRKGRRPRLRGLGTRRNLVLGGGALVLTVALLYTLGPLSLPWGGEGGGDGTPPLSRSGNAWVNRGLEDTTGPATATTPLWRVLAASAFIPDGEYEQVRQAWTTERETLAGDLRERFPGVDVKLMTDGAAVYLFVGSAPTENDPQLLELLEYLKTSPRITGNYKDARILADPS